MQSNCVRKAFLQMFILKMNCDIKVNRLLHINYLIGPCKQPRQQLFSTYVLLRNTTLTTGTGTPFPAKTDRLCRLYSMSKMSKRSKEFSFGDYDIIGFDLDCTLLRYNLNEMVPLVYDLLCRYLVEQKNYPRALLEEKKLQLDFMQKGLILDAVHGNILKLSADATILRATHGSKLLSDAKIVEIYGAKRQWSISTKFFENPLSTWNGPLAEKMRTLLDYFDLAAGLVFAQAVDVLDEQQCTNATASYNVWPDLLDGLMQIYSRDNFNNGQSGYFTALRADPDRYLLRTSDAVVQWLQQLRESGKAIYLLTGSNIDFANFTASYAMGDNWQELFDSVICFAKKPGFFTLSDGAQRSYLRIEKLTEMPGSELSLTHPLSLNTTYSQGNWSQLREMLAKKLGKPAAEVNSLYVGDNLIQDVYSPVKHHDLDAVALSEELLAEEDVTREYEFRDIVASKFWGSYFSLDQRPTLWASTIANYSKICIPLLDDVAVESPISHKFIGENADGYFPKAPTTLVS